MLRQTCIWLENILTRICELMVLICMFWKRQNWLRTCFTESNVSVLFSFGIIICFRVSVDRKLLIQKK